MGIDWEEILGSSGADMADAYDDMVEDSAVKKREPVVERRECDTLSQRMLEPKGFQDFAEYFASHPEEYDVMDMTEWELKEYVNELAGGEYLEVNDVLGFFYDLGYLADDGITEEGKAAGIAKLEVTWNEEEGYVESVKIRDKQGELVDFCGDGEHSWYAIPKELCQMFLKNLDEFSERIIIGF